MISATAASTFLPSGSICALRAIICPSRASTRPRNSANCVKQPFASASATSSPAPWCARVITRTNRLNPPPPRGWCSAAMLSALLVVLGFFAGLLGALTGIGGGVLLTPILALHFGIPIRQAIGTSLIAVITTSAASSSIHLQRHTTDIRLGMTLELATALGAAVTAYLVGYFNRNALEGIFAAFLLYSSGTILSRGGKIRKEEQEEVAAGKNGEITIPPYEPKRYPLGLGASLV